MFDSGHVMGAAVINRYLLERKDAGVLEKTEAGAKLAAGFRRQVTAHTGEILYAKHDGEDVSKPLGLGGIFGEVIGVAAEKNV